MATTYRTYGKKSDGTLSVCRAKPEHRGKGRCKHYDHVELSSDNLEAFVREYNEQALEEYFSKRAELRRKGLLNNKVPQGVTANKIKSHEGGNYLSRKELTEGANKVAASFREKDWSFIQEFHKKYDQHIDEENQHYLSAVEDIAEYLQSDDTTARKLRGFLGKDVNLYELSEIMVFQVKSMTSPETWKENRRSSMNRVIFTTLNNDMNRNRYIASVLFFGGRCCYCNRVLRKNPPPGHQASGEHLTPVGPDDENSVHGGTRYGNMALACITCNGSRKNTDLEEWISTTRRIKKEDKSFVLGRIQAFREFALYEEYSKAENDVIVKHVEKLQAFVDSCRGPDNQYKEGTAEMITDRIKITLYDLRHADED